MRSKAAKIHKSHRLLGILVPFTLSLLLNELSGRFFKRYVQTVIFIPYFFSWAILGGILNAGFDQIFILSNPIVNETVDIIDTFVYRFTDYRVFSSPALLPRPFRVFWGSVASSGTVLPLTVMPDQA